jgi:RNA 3'-terminal phosphate cyclase-like protein
MNHNLGKGDTNNLSYNDEPLERKQMELPEDLGKRSATLLLHEIYRGGCIDTSCQSFALLMMCLTPEDVSRIRLGPLSQYTVVSLRLFKEAFGVEFKLRVDEEEVGGRSSGGDGDSDEEEDAFGGKRVGQRTVICSCLGIGYRNMARAST